MDMLFFIINTHSHTILLLEKLWVKHCGILIFSRMKEKDVNYMINKKASTSSSKFIYT